MTDPELPGTKIGLGLGEDVDLLRFQEAAGFEVAPEAEELTPAEWLRANLFSSWFNSVVTVVAGIVVGFVLYQIFKLVFISGEWEIVRFTLRGYMVGSFPVEELWRVWASFYLVVVLAGLSIGASRARFRLTPRRSAVAALIVAAVIGFLFFAVKTALVLGLLAGIVVALAATIAAGRLLGRDRLRRWLIVGWLLAFPIIIFLVRFGDGVSPRLWGGFFFNIIAAAFGIFVSFPIGILLALGRRSELPAIRTFCVVFIEIFRGVPLVAWLIFSKFVLDLFLPPQMPNPPDIVKALVAFTLFSAAYVAEIVRGGLQGVDAGQHEAARALGLSTTRLMALIVLPQALRSTIPAMISHFISLFKDTSLFVAIEVFELLAAARNSANNPEFIGHDMEALLFAGLMFWMVAFSMARWSQRLELRLGVGER